MDTFKQLSITYNPDDDTIDRLVTIPCTTTNHHNSLPNQQIFTHDIPLNSSHKTSLRLYKPINPPLHAKLPLVVFIHGGGFLFASPFNTIYNDFCTSMAISLGVVVLSVGYRLAPESRLPAAYEDALEALTWVRDQADNILLKDMVDFSNCYLMGDSAGGNIVYHAGLRALSINLEPLVIKGYIFIQPFFGGMKRTESEVRLADDKILSSVVSDLLWELGLPKGSDRDHEYCNPMVGGGFSDKIELLTRCFLVALGGDLLVDRQKEFMKMLEEKGVEVVSWFEDEGCHGMFLFEPEKALHLFEVIKDFIYQPMPTV